MPRRSYITTLPLKDLDLSFLPEQARLPGTFAFKTALILHFSTLASRRGEDVMVAVDDEAVTVLAFRTGTTPFQFGLELLQGGQLAEGASFLESLAKEPAQHTAELFYNLGVAYSELGECAEAIIRLKRAVQLDPTHSHAWTALGVAYIRLGKNDESMEPLQRAVREDPADGYAQRNLGGLLFSRGDVAGAVCHLRAAVQALPMDAQALYGLAMALEMSGDERVTLEALRLLDRHEQLAPNSPVAREARAARSRLLRRPPPTPR